MKIVVIGGSGLISSMLVNLLRQSCQDVVSTSAGRLAICPSATVHNKIGFIAG
jgi:hypothetical protein